MTLHEVVLKVTFSSFFTELTRRFPSAKVFIWCNRQNDVIELVVNKPDEYPLVVDEMRKTKIANVVEESSDERRLYFIVHRCNCMLRNTIVRHIGTLDVLNVFPNMIEDGWVYHRLIVFRHEHFEELLRRLEKWEWNYKIMRKVPFDGFLASSLTLTADALFSGLTEKQLSAMLTAFRYGYYNLPRSMDLQTIAAKEKVPRTTFQEHLKKAENKLVTAVVPYVHLFSLAPTDRRATLRIK